MSGDHSISMSRDSGAQSKSPGKVAYLGYLEGFRGMAIIFVVMIHANNAMLQRGVEGVTGDFSWVWTTFHILSHNSTVYFALISGVLYAYHLHRKPHGVFLRSRIEAVVVPYILVSVVLTLALAGIATLRGDGAIQPSDLAGQIAYNILFGEAWNTLWYIPVIAVLYVISPLLLRLLEDRNFGLPFAALMVLLPLVVSRTGTEVTPSMLLFFAGVYTVGLLIGRDPENSLERLQRSTTAIAIVAFLAAATVWALDRSGIEFVGPTSIRESAIYVLRIALALLMLIGLRAYYDRFGPLANRALKLIAAYSFGIYFLHAPLLRPIVKVVGWFVPEGNPSWALAAAVLVTFAISLVSTTLIVWAIKTATGKYSKYIIGS